jgi:AcrR family transcriptional regulator
MAQEETRDKLLHAGERLFAERGIGPVSMREINKAAGQRNTSAIHYHFGSKDALIQAIFEKRMREYNTRRLQLLDDVEARGESGDIHKIVQASLLPLAEGLSGPGQNLNYILFIGQVMNESSHHVQLAVTAPFSEGMKRTREMIGRVLEDVPESVLRERMVLAIQLIIHSMGQRARLLRSESGKSPSRSNEAFLADLIDFICGGISAPVSEESASYVVEKVGTET